MNYYEEIKKILSMKEWKDKKFDSLLTSGIWNSNYGEIKKIWGPANGIYAYGGEIGFLFDKMVFYYFMDEYDVRAKEPKDGSLCYGAGCKLRSCISSMENRMYSFDELREKLGVDIYSFLTDEEDEYGADFVYSHEFSYAGLLFRFYSDSMHIISSNSIVFIKINENV